MIQNMFSVNQTYTVKPLYSGHHLDQNNVRYREVSATKVLPKLAYFASKTCSKVIGYSVINLKVCQEVDVGRRKRSLKTMYSTISCLHDNLEATGWRLFAMRDRANQRSGPEFSL